MAKDDGIKISIGGMGEKSLVQIGAIDEEQLDHLDQLLAEGQAAVIYIAVPAGVENPLEVAANCLAQYLGTGVVLKNGNEVNEDD